MGNSVEGSRTYQWNVALTGQSLIFKLLGKAFYVYPEALWFKTLVQSDIFSEAPFAAEQREVVSGLGLLQHWARSEGGVFSDQMLDVAVKIKA